MNVHDYHTSQFDLGFGCIWPFTHNTGSWREGARQTEFALLVDGVTSCVVLARLRHADLLYINRHQHVTSESTANGKS